MISGGRASCDLIRLCFFGGALGWRWRALPTPRLPASPTFTAASVTSVVPSTSAGRTAGDPPAAAAFYHAS